MIEKQDTSMKERNKIDFEQEMAKEKSGVFDNYDESLIVIRESTFMIILNNFSLCIAIAAGVCFCLHPLLIFETESVSHWGHFVRVLLFSCDVAFTLEAIVLYTWTCIVFTPSFEYFCYRIKQPITPPSLTRALLAIIPLFIFVYIVLTYNFVTFAAICYRIYSSGT